MERWGGGDTSKIGSQCQATFAVQHLQGDAIHFSVPRFNQTLNKRERQGGWNCSQTASKCTEALKQVKTTQTREANCIVTATVTVSGASWWCSLAARARARAGLAQTHGSTKGSRRELDLANRGHPNIQPARTQATTDHSEKKSDARQTAERCGSCTSRWTLQPQRARARCANAWTASPARSFSFVRRDSDNEWERQQPEGPPADRRVVATDAVSLDERAGGGGGERETIKASWMTHLKQGWQRRYGVGEGWGGEGSGGGEGCNPV
jgi:hypothetical protein